jgi:transposase
MNSPLMNTRQSAAYVGLSPRTMEDHRIKGTGATFRRLGNRVLYRLEDLDAWIDARAFSSTSEYPVAQAAA